MSSAIGLAKLGAALWQNWLLALLVLVQSVLKYKTQHGLGLVLILAAQLGSAWLFYGVRRLCSKNILFCTFRACSGACAYRL